MWTDVRAPVHVCKLRVWTHTRLHVRAGVCERILHTCMCANALYADVRVFMVPAQALHARGLFGLFCINALQLVRRQTCCRESICSVMSQYAIGSLPLHVHLTILYVHHHMDPYY